VPSNRAPLRSIVLGVAAVAVAVLAGATAVAAPPTGATRSAPSQVVPVAGDVVDLLVLQTSSDRRFVDEQGRDVLLRGANVNSLAEYWQGVPGLGPTVALTEADYDEMAARGFSVVRLLITWSRVEPIRGEIDEAYLDEVSDVVSELAERGIYTVIDMHQDAYSASISTTDPSSCPSGTTPAKGWDGAPAWATITDGLSTCLTGSDRNSSPAVNRAWNHFYDDTDGIRTRFAAAWGAVADRFEGRPEVAGFDVLNEPETSRPADELKPRYEDLLVDVIGAIRSAQDDAPFDHIVFVEPTVPAGDNSRGIVIPDPEAAGIDTANISASVHNYSESIGGGSIEGLNEAIEAFTAGLGIPNWGGEYGFWDTSEETLAKARRYAADEDRLAWGGAWWQWRQSCGDPHAVSWSDGEVVPATETQTHLNLLGCPGDVDLGPNEDFLRILGRGYPRAAPGRIDELRSDPVTGALRVTATVDRAGGELVVWTPTRGPEHPVRVLGLDEPTEVEVPGGRLIVARVSAPGTYVLAIGEDPIAPTAPTAPEGPSGPAPAVPVSGTAGYTG
jgi:endoglycosylceramidase